MRLINNSIKDASMEQRFLTMHIVEQALMSFPDLIADVTRPVQDLRQAAPCSRQRM